MDKSESAQWCEILSVPIHLLLSTSRRSWTAVSAGSHKSLFWREVFVSSALSTLVTPITRLPIGRLFTEICLNGRHVNVIDIRSG